MAPYVPQNAHYAHLDVCEYLTEDIYAFVGHGGRRFYNMTRKLGLKYLWFNPENKVIEVWGSYETLLMDPVKTVHEELVKFMSQKNIREGDNVVVTINNNNVTSDPSSRCQSPLARSE